MELTLWWVEEKDWEGIWKPAYGPYVDQYKAEEKAWKMGGYGEWSYREPTTRVNGIIIKGEEA